MFFLIVNIFLFLFFHQSKRLAQSHLKCRFVLFIWSLVVVSKTKSLCCVVAQKVNQIGHIAHVKIIK